MASSRPLLPAPPRIAPAPSAPSSASTTPGTTTSAGPSRSLPHSDNSPHAQPVASTSSSITHGAGGGKRKAGSGKASHKVKGGDDSDDSMGGGDEEGRKRKRNRMALSCAECKRRKIKCDRAVPLCGQCERRNDASNCTWDILSNESSLPTSIARTADLQTVIARLAHIEQYLQTLPPNLATFKPFSSTGQHQYHLGYGDSRLGASGPGGAGGDRGGRNGVMNKLGLAERERPLFEDAAMDLEDGVFGSASLRKNEDGLGPKSPQAMLNALQGAPVRPGLRAPGGGVGGQSFADGGSFTGGGSGVGGSGQGGGGRGELRFGGKPVERTKALTCIVRTEPLNSSAPFSRVGLAVEFDATPEEVAKARQEAMQRILRALPGKDTVLHLVDLYFGRAAWLFHHLHAGSFLSEVEAFYVLQEQGRIGEVDILWVALLLMVICVTLDSTHTSRSPLSLADPTQPSTSSASDPSPLSNFSEEYLCAQPEIWFQAAQAALALAEWETVPRVRSIQTIIFFTQYLQISSPHRGKPSQISVWLAGAIRLAMVLGLHVLGSNPEVMPADDPAFPPGKNAVKREQSKRIWGVLVYQDWTAASSKKSSYLISPLHFDTDDPSNVNDRDLSPIDWKVDALPPNVLTDSTADRIRIAMSRQARKVYDSVILKKDTEYETVLELDKGYHEILDSLPDRWTLGVTQEETEQPMLRYQRHFALEGVHNRIFRLHRPYSTRGYSEDKYRYSTDACIKSARVVVVSTHNISDACKDIWYTYSHVLMAALILFNDLFQAIDKDLPAAEYDAKKGTLFLASQIFDRSSSITSADLREVVEQGSKVLAGLFRAEESRRVSRAARALVSAAGVEEAEGDAEVESFSEVLQRIWRSLDSQGARHTGTPPPRRNIPLPSFRVPTNPTFTSAYPPTSTDVSTLGFDSLNAPAGVAQGWAFPTATSLSSGPDYTSSQFMQSLQMPPDSNFFSPGLGASSNNGGGNLESTFGGGGGIGQFSYGEWAGDGSGLGDGLEAPPNASAFGFGLDLDFSDGSNQMTSLLGELSGTSGW